MTGTASSSNIRRLAATLFVLGFMLRVLVPAGWMPAHVGHAFTLTPCAGWADPLTHGDAQAHVGHEADGDHGKKSDKRDTSAPCTFAAATAKIASAAPVPALALPIVTDAPVVLHALLVAVGRGLVAPPPPSTGPPARS